MTNPAQEEPTPEPDHIHTKELSKDDPIHHLAEGHKAPWFGSLSTVAEIHGILHDPVD